MEENKGSDYINYNKLQQDFGKNAIQNAQRSTQEKVKKWANKIQVGANVKSQFADKKEGDVWEDADGKTWTVKDGIIQSISKLASAKSPWFCPKPECGKIMNHRLDDISYRKFGHCFDCQINFEHELRLAGKYEAYERKKIRENERAFLRDKIESHKTYITEFKTPKVYFETGEYEELAKRGEFEQLFAMIETDIKFMEDRLKQIDIEEQEDEVNN